MARPPQYLAPKLKTSAVSSTWPGCAAGSVHARPATVAASTGNATASSKHPSATLWKTDFLRLNYAMRSTGRVAVERLTITTTATRFGGRRHWFRCPDCSRRCRILYGADRFRCRECLGARYEFQYQNEAMNISSRALAPAPASGGAWWCPWAGDLDDGFPSQAS